MVNILIAEDEELLAQALYDSLSATDCNVSIAKDGVEAIKQLEKSKPDLILLDLLMPKRDGFYVLGEARNNPDWRTIPIIVLSNLGEEIAIKRAMDMGANDYYIKSKISIKNLAEKIKQYIQKK